MRQKVCDLSGRMGMMGNLACVFCLGLLCIYLPSGVVLATGSAQKPSSATLLRKESLTQVEMDTVAEAGNEFTFDLYQSLGAERADQNLLVSPYSANMALSMTLAGAGGDTASQMKTVMHYTKINENLLHESVAALSAKIIQSSSDRNLARVANRVYSQQGFELVSDFEQVMDENYKAPIEAVDFSMAVETADKINNWVEERTENKINNLISPDALNSLTRMVLVNALYFKGEWKTKFAENETQTGEFYASPTETIKIKMMYKKAKFNHTVDRNLKCQILEIPFADETFSFVAILPDEGQSLADIQTHLSNDQLNKWMKSLRSREVTVYLPKFKLEDEFTLKEPLTQLGMGDAFDLDRADFSSISTCEGLYISDVFQKTFFEVTEEGAEAAAATAVVMLSRMMPMELEFTANRPFLFLLKHKGTDSILFMGHLAKPDPI